MGEALNEAGVYGAYEATEAKPDDLDACGAHFGVTPDSGGAEVYHHHVQEKPPFTIGCVPVSVFRTWPRRQNTNDLNARRAQVLRPERRRRARDV